MNEILGKPNIWLTYKRGTLTPHKNSLINQEASGSLEDLEIIQEEDTHPSLDTSLNHEDDDLEIDEPQSDIVPIRRSTRTRHAPDRMCLYIDAEDHELGDLGEPANYKAALLDPESEKWLNAMNVEMQSMKDNEEKLKLSKSQGDSTPAEMKRMQNVPYASAVGSIVYAVRCTRPNVAFAQNVTSQFQQNPGDIHWTTVKNILKYLRNTKDMFLVYGGDLKPELRVSCYTDAGYLTDSAKQSIFATSSAEAEYIFAFDASKEAVWVREFISGQGVVPTIEEPISMYCDNTGTIAIANESGITKGARHFRAKVHYLQEVIEFCDIKLEKVHTYDNLADPFTKALAFPKHSEHTRNIGMLPASSLM
nr:hypothetical protein [Tanacetum cinerariifolium]